MNDFNAKSSGDTITRAVNGKTILSVGIVDDDFNNVLEFRFSDNSALRLEYDWIYGWDVVIA